MMIRFKALVLIVLCSTQLTFAMGGKSMTLLQAQSNEKSIVAGGIGIGVGVFSPAEVNEYIEDQTSHLTIFGGTTGLIANFFGKASITVRPHRIIEISGFIEGAWAPKYIMVDVGDDYYFSFTRVSPGVSPKIHIPIGTGRHSIYFAPAVTYNFLKFKDGQSSQPEFKGNSLGGKIQIGFNLDFRKIQLQPFIGYDHAKATDTESGGFELNYSAAQLGVEFHF